MIITQIDTPTSQIMLSPLGPATVHVMPVAVWDFCVSSLPEAQVNYEAEDFVVDQAKLHYESVLSPCQHEHSELDAMFSQEYMLGTNPSYSFSLIPTRPPTHPPAHSVIVSTPRNFCVRCRDWLELVCFYSAASFSTQTLPLSFPYHSKPCTHPTLSLPPSLFHSLPGCGMPC